MMLEGKNIVSDPDKRRTVCITGASGFIGSHLLARLQGANFRIKVLTRSENANIQGVTICKGNIFEPESLRQFMSQADLVINLAQPADDLPIGEFREGFRNLARAARGARVDRLVHVSTAMVVGAATTTKVTEETPNLPRTDYEHRKLAAEQVLQSELGQDLDLGILRPTAVFGAGGQNLLKLLNTVRHGSALKRASLRILHGKRRMHLVSVKDVVEAIVFLAVQPRALAGNAFLISADEVPDNNYQAVDSILGQSLGKPMATSSLSIPNPVLHLLLHSAGRSQANPDLMFDASKIRSWGFNYRSDFSGELRDFAALASRPKGNR